MVDLEAQARENAAQRLSSLQAKLLPWRIASCLATVVVAIVLAGQCLYLISHWHSVISSLRSHIDIGLVFFAFYSLVLPFFLYIWQFFRGRRVRPGPVNEWTIGRYSERDIRSLVQECAKGLPASFSRALVRITEERGTQACTLLSLLWPGWGGRPIIWISSGTLHYLTPKELQAVILHEMAHHIPKTRISIPGSWFLVTGVLLITAWFVGANVDPGAGAWCYILLYTGIIISANAVSVNASRKVEHACDLYAATRMGVSPIANVILKIGEEAELTEAVLALAARRSIGIPALESDDLLLAFEETRPHGRIFHDNLFRHASEVMKCINQGTSESPGARPRRKRKNNSEFEKFLAERKKRRAKRIRWRVFDRNNSGSLSVLELAQLARSLRAHPNHCLVVAEGETHLTTHPSHRERILVLADCIALDENGVRSTTAEPS
jgi:Zn-dependent protease with chaperone function